MNTIIKKDTKVNHNDAINSMKKMNRKISAHLKGKRTKITIPNPNENEKDRPFITMSGFDYWGDPKGRFTKKESKE
jgi:hypothetical protein